MGGHLIAVKIVGSINENLVDGIGVDVLRRNVLQIDLVYPCAVFNVVGHPRRRNNIIQLQFRTCL